MSKIYLSLIFHPLLYILVKETLSVFLPYSVEHQKMLGCSAQSTGSGPVEDWAMVLNA